MCLIYLSLTTVSAIDDTDVPVSQNPIIDEISINFDEPCLNLRDSKTIEITQDNYNDYFNQYTGEIKSTADIKSGDTLKIGNVSNHAFVIDRQLTIMPISPNDEISNGIIHLTKGSDHSTVTNLTINNTKGILTINTQEVGMLHGIWLSDTNYNDISNNIIRIANSGGVYAMPMHNSNYNNIINNDMKTWVTCNIIMAESNYNLISQNTIEVLSYSDLSVTNLIYFSPFAFAGRIGSSLCIGNTITYNNLIGFSTMPMSIIIQAVYANNVNTTIAHNIIYKGSYGINLFGDNAFVYNNTVNNSAIGIVTEGSNISVIDNRVSGLSQGTGIAVIGRENTNDVACGNNITFKDVSRAMFVGDYVNAYNNIINVADYGVGIIVSGNKSKVHDNKVKTSYDDAIQFLSNNAIIEDNILITNARGISITTANLDRYYNNTISGNKITSDSYGIYMKGLVYNTTISNNVIESNASVGIYKDITDELSDSNADNMINGVIYDATALIIDDTNFYEYFDENGYLNYTFGKGKSNSIILTFLSNKNIFIDKKINVISNKMDNLLFNVSVTFLDGSQGSLIRDLNFMNFNKNVIVLNDADNVNVASNNITLIFSEGSKDSAAIFIVGVGDNNIISGNNIYVNSKIDYAYAISASAFNPYNLMYNKEFSKGFTISNNNIIMIAKGMAEAIFSDAIVDSDIIKNNINIIADENGYGIAGVNVIGRLYNWNISGNEIIIHSKKMAYLIEVHMFDNMTIEDNYLYSQSNGSYAVATYMSNRINVTNNEIIINAGDLSNIKDNMDVITSGNAAVYISGLNNNISITDNVIDTNASNPIITDDKNSTVDVTDNGYVLSDYNYDVYFNENHTINNNVIYEGNSLLLANLTEHQTLIINKTIALLPYRNFIPSVSIILNATLGIYNMSFYNTTIYLNNVSDVEIINNTFNSSVIFVTGGFNNYLINNAFINASLININNSYGDIIKSNDFAFNGFEMIIINNSESISILNNNINATGNDLKVIALYNSNHNLIESNNINADLSTGSGIYASNSSYNDIKSNDVLINGKSELTNQSGILLMDNSSKNNIVSNFIISSSVNGGDYAIMLIEDENLFNNIYLNYLISDKGNKRADEAVYSLHELIEGNTPYVIYVSDEGSDIAGDGSESNPYSTIAYALSKSFNHAVINVIKGTFIESNLIIDKNITISAVNSVVINANNQQLFTIASNGTLTVNGIAFKNGFDVDGGSLFKNNGSLFIYNSVISDSASYYDNSHPVFDHIVDETSSTTINCTHMGMGGAILNYGNLFINNSLINNNFAHIGGAIADFGKTKINSSRIISNQAVHGGAIYTDSPYALEIDNSIFDDNRAIISLDYCMIRKAQSSWSIDTGYAYSYSSLCDDLMAAGGAIFSRTTDMIISNSQFTGNNAWKGGAIATKFVSSSSKTKLPVSITLNNCLFEDNRATNTVHVNENLAGNYPYNSDYKGGAIFGAFESFHAYGTDFLSNQAGIDDGFSGDGGALKVQSNDGVIDSCKFIDNRAGLTGGALDISNNFIITRTIISNNSAMYGGAINYQSYSYYGHVQDNLNIYNSTISNNMALNSGGAFRVGQSNITVNYCNIYDNSAPEGSTMSASYIGAGPDKVSADMRYNYWGTNEFGKVLGADNSVYNFPNVITGRKSNTKINWVAVDEKTDNDDNPVLPIDSGDSEDNPGRIIVNPGTTRPGTGTGTEIGAGGNGNGGSGDVSSTGNKPGSGNNMGEGDGGKWGDGGSQSSTNRNASNTISNVDSSDVFSSSSNRSSSNHESADHESSDSPNSNSYKGNDENEVVNVNNTSMGESSSSSSDASPSGSEADSAGSSASQASSSSKSYELNEKTVKELDNNVDIFIIIGVLALIFILFIIGYKRRENDEDY